MKFLEVGNFSIPIDQISYLRERFVGIDPYDDYDYVTLIYLNSGKIINVHHARKDEIKVMMEE